MSVAAGATFPSTLPIPVDLVAVGLLVLGVTVAVSWLLWWFSQE